MKTQRLAATLLISVVLFSHLSGCANHRERRITPPSVRGVKSGIGSAQSSIHGARSDADEIDAEAGAALEQVPQGSP